jgi:hypothetical protein
LYTSQGSEPQNITFTIERAKGLFDPADLVELISTGNSDQDDGALKAVMEHVKDELHDKDIQKKGVVKYPYPFTIKGDLHVEMGFRTYGDITTTDNKSPLFDTSTDCYDRHDNLNVCTFIYCFLLAWTPEQLELKNQTKILGKNQVRRGRKAKVVRPGGAKGDYESSEEDLTP